MINSNKLYKKIIFLAKDLSILTKEILFPEKCLGCGTIYKKRYLPYLCQNCFNQIKIHSFPFCPICQRKLPFYFHRRTKKIYLPSCYHQGENQISWLGAATDYNNPLIQKLLKAYKYQFIKEISLTLSAILAKYLIESELEKIIKKEWLIIPIPLYPRRERWRGFNQSELIASLLAEKFNLSLKKDILFRKKPTKEQAGLTLKEREENIKDAFEVKKEVKNKKIILLDDVYTSGLTVKEAARALKKAGAKKIACLTVALKISQ
ncbi:ComF family protein [bacterium]|nr:ComF family protein [bacterium]